MNMVQAKSLFATSLEQIKQLKNSIHILKTSLYASQQVWKNEIEKPMMIKQHLEATRTQISNPQIMTNLKIRMKNWKKRKESRIRKNKARKASIESRLLQTETKHTEIDHWRNNIIQKTLDEKQKAQMKAEADSILEEVRKKITDAKKICQRMTVLEKLRQARKENALKKGLCINFDNDDMYEKGIQSIRKTMEERLKVYEVEERALQVMLQSEKDVENERIQNEKDKEDSELWEERKRDILESLFSSGSLLNLPSEIGHLYANRMSWDQFMVSPHDFTSKAESSCIPVGWITPDLPSTSNWALALDQKDHSP